jgi:putative acetyltransferase
VHALDLDALRAPEITFLAARDNGDLIGCGALKALDTTSGEVKSVRTAHGHLRKGVAADLLVRFLETAHDRSYQQVKLETGRPAAFAPAQRLYKRFGFAACALFADYTDDPFSL